MRRLSNGNSRIGLLEHDRFISQPIEGGGVHKRRAIETQVIAAECIANNENDVGSLSIWDMPRESGVAKDRMGIRRILQALDRERDVAALGRILEWNRGSRPLSDRLISACL
jgi:hypothetical protein